MKRKFSLLINIATLALCVCAIAFGVYSAKTASLNVGGSVGFVAHNCEIELNGTIVACENSNATATKEVTIPQTFIGRGAVPSTYSLNLNKTFSGSESGKMYFSDLFDGGKIITITLKVKNQSKFDVVANVSRPTFENSACTMSVKLDNVELAEAGTSIELTKDGATEAVMVIKITLNNDANDISDTTISGDLFKFEKKMPVSLINFKIGNNPYQAAEGMTWAEWVDSSYNTHGFVVFSGGIYSHDLSWRVRWDTASSTPLVVKDSENIIANHGYIFEVGGAYN